MPNLIDTWFNAIGRASNYATMVYYPGTGGRAFEINFSGGYIAQSDVKAFMVNDITRERIDLVLTFPGQNSVWTSQPVPTGWTICIYRDTPKAMPLAKFVDGAIINAANLDRNAKQAVFAVSEMVDRFDSTVASVESALVQVAQANAKADQAIQTANNADAKANRAIIVADDAYGKAVSAIGTANAAAGTSAGAVQTANTAKQTADQAKQTADGLNAQIVAANKTAGEAKAIAEGIDAKASSALTKADQAIATANSAKATAEAIDGKATQAQKDAAAALAATEVARDLASRVANYPNATDVNWKGAHNFSQVYTTYLKNTGSSELAYVLLSETNPQIDFARKGTGKAVTLRSQVDSRLEVLGGLDIGGTVTTTGSLRTNGTITAGAGDIVAETGNVRAANYDLKGNGRRHLTYTNSAGTADMYVYKDPGTGPYVMQHANSNSGLEYRFDGDLAFNGGGGTIRGVYGVEFPAGKNGTTIDQWIRRSGNSTTSNFQFGIGGLEMLNLSYSTQTGCTAYFQNNLYAPGLISTSSIVRGNNLRANDGNREAIYYADGNISGQIWGGSDLYSWLTSNVKNRAVMNVARSGAVKHDLSGQNSWECPDGHFLTGYGSRPQDGNVGFVGWYSRALMYYRDAGGWIQAGSL